MVRKRSSKISSIALINDKNRKKNIERAEQGIRLEMERIKREGTVSRNIITRPSILDSVCPEKRSQRDLRELKVT